MGSLGWPEILIILGVLVLLFGAKRLPDMARSVGQSARVFKGEMKGLRDDGTEPDPAEAPRPQVESRPEQRAEPRTEPRSEPGPPSGQ
jgi:sec-independent protein translocase protein TatA